VFKGQAAVISKLLKPSSQRSADERFCTIYALKKTGPGQTATANAVAVHKSTICREFKQGESG